MARGAPDYMVVTGGRTPELYTTYSQIQIPIMLLDDFETTVIKWTPSSLTTLSLDSTPASYPNPSPVISGDKCLKITGTADLEATVFRFVAPTEVLTNIGVSFYFYCNDWKNMFKTFETAVTLISVAVMSSSLNKDFRIYYQPSTHKWYYSNDIGDTTVEFATIVLDDTRTNYIKLLLDLVNNKALWIIINGIKFNFTDVSLYVTSGTYTPVVQLVIAFTSSTSKAGVIYIDDYKVTYNEPG